MQVAQDADGRPTDVAVFNAMAPLGESSRSRLTTLLTHERPRAVGEAGWEWSLEWQFSDAAPWDALPKEVLDVVCDHVALRDVGSMLRTCRAWRHKLQKSDTIKMAAQCATQMHAGKQQVIANQQRNLRERQRLEEQRQRSKWVWNHLGLLLLPLTLPFLLIGIVGAAVFTSVQVPCPIYLYQLHWTVCACYIFNGVALTAFLLYSLPGRPFKFEVGQMYVLCNSCGTITSTAILVLECIIINRSRANDCAYGLFAFSCVALAFGIVQFIFTTASSIVFLDEYRSCCR